MKKSLLAFLFSVSVLAVLGPRDEAEGQVGKKPMPKQPVHGTPSVLPVFPSGQPGKNTIPADLQLPDNLQHPLKVPKGSTIGGTPKFPGDPGHTVFTPKPLAGAKFTPAMEFHKNMFAALGKNGTTNKYVKTSLAKFGPQALLIQNNMHKHYHVDQWFAPNWWLNHPCGCPPWHYSHHYHKHPHWWWFQTPNWTVCTDWVVYDWTCPFYYDCGVNVLYRDNFVYVNSVSVASAQDYAYQAYQLAEVVAPPPERKIEFLPLGVYALASSRQALDSDLVLQLAVTPQGEFSGTLYNRGTDSTVPVAGRVHPETQRVAIQLSEKKDLVLDTGFQNLTLDHSCVFMHFGNLETGTWLTQTWFLVRLPPLPKE
jgi:hypothetical protein